MSVTPDGEGGECDCHDIGRPDAVLAQETERGVENKAVLQDEKKEGGVGCWILST